jgi:hypothetical protein
MAKATFVKRFESLSRHIEEVNWEAMCDIELIARKKLNEQLKCEIYVQFYRVILPIL